MSSIENFLDLETVSLKICGVTTLDDAQLLAKMGVDALGVNFWPNSNILIISVSGNFMSLVILIGRRNLVLLRQPTKTSGTPRLFPKAAPTNGFSHKNSVRNEKIHITSGAPFANLRVPLASRNRSSLGVGWT